MSSARPRRICRWPTSPSHKALVPPFMIPRTNAGSSIPPLLLLQQQLVKAIMAANPSSAGYGAFMCAYTGKGQTPHTRTHNTAPKREKKNKRTKQRFSRQNHTERKKERKKEERRKKKAKRKEKRKKKRKKKKEKRFSVVLLFCRHFFSPTRTHTRIHFGLKRFDYAKRARQSSGWLWVGYETHRQTTATTTTATTTAAAASEQTTKAIGKSRNGEDDQAPVPVQLSSARRLVRAPSRGRAGTGTAFQRRKPCTALG